MTAADNGGGRVADNNGEGQERAANNNGIRHRAEKAMLSFLVGVIQFFVVRTICCFWLGSYNFLCVWGFANKKESHTYDSVYCLGREKTTENILNITFFWENVLVPLYRCMLSFVEIRHWCIFNTT